jgi:hypothetical protein
MGFHLSPCLCLVILAAFFPIVAMSETFQCKLCDDNVAMTAPRARYDFQSCAGLENNLQEADEVACSDFFADPGKSFLNYPSFCGCEGVPAPQICQFCDDGYVLNNSKARVPWEDQDDQYTCEMAAKIAKHVSDPTACSSWVATPAVKELCCKPASSTGTGVKLLFSLSFITVALTGIFFKA